MRIPHPRGRFAWWLLPCTCAPSQATDRHFCSAPSDRETLQGIRLQPNTLLAEDLRIYRVEDYDPLVAMFRFARDLAVQAHRQFLTDNPLAGAAARDESVDADSEQKPEIRPSRRVRTDVRQEDTL